MYMHAFIYQKSTEKNIVFSDPELWIEIFHNDVYFYKMDVLILTQSNLSWLTFFLPALRGSLCTLYS